MKKLLALTLSLLLLALFILPVFADIPAEPPRPDGGRGAAESPAPGSGQSSNTKGCASMSAQTVSLCCGVLVIAAAVLCRTILKSRKEASEK